MSQLHLKWVRSAKDRYPRDTDEASNYYELREDDGTLVAEGDDHDILMALCDRTGVEIDYGPDTGAAKRHPSGRKGVPW
jgi:hypothetical protein